MIRGRRAGGLWVVGNAHRAAALRTRRIALADRACGGLPGQGNPPAVPEKRRHGVDADDGHNAASGRAPPGGFPGDAGAPPSGCRGPQTCPALQSAFPAGSVLRRRSRLFEKHRRCPARTDCAVSPLCCSDAGAPPSGCTAALVCVVCGAAGPFSTAFYRPQRRASCSPARGRLCQAAAGKMGARRRHGVRRRARPVTS